MHFFPITPSRPVWSLRFHPAAPAVSTFVKPFDRDRLLDRVRQLTTADQSKIRLLLIDDDTSLHELLDEKLTHLGYTLESAFNGETGFAAAKANPRRHDPRPDDARHERLRGLPAC